MKILHNSAMALVAVLMTATFATTVVAAEQGVTDNEILVGSVGVMTGSYYIYGKLTMNGLDAVFDKVNEAGGVHGRKIRLIREDDFCKPEGAIAAVKKLTYEHKVFAIVGGACSNAMIDTIKMLRDRGLTILLVEQNVGVAAAAAGRAYVLKDGEIAYTGEARELINNAEVLSSYLGR